jgi:hypothetical protein
MGIPWISLRPLQDLDSQLLGRPPSDRNGQPFFNQRVRFVNALLDF